MDLKFTKNSFVIFSKSEFERVEQINHLKSLFSNLVIIDPVYPKNTKIPFLKKIIEKSKEETGNYLLENEVGVILSHRKIWSIIKKANTKDNIHYLILESDSKVKNLNILLDNYQKVESCFDLFFWGAWNGNSVIKKSTVLFKNKSYKIGEPFLKTVYGAYGYSINSKAAKYLLDKTSNISHPIDIYNKYIDHEFLRIGIIKPEIIGTWLTTKSNIRRENIIMLIYRYIIMKIFYIIFKIKSYFY